MKIHNPSDKDIASIPVINGDPIQLKAGESMECTEAMGKWMIETWGFLSQVSDEPKEVQKEEPKMTELVPDEPEPVVEVKPKRVKKEKV